MEKYCYDYSSARESCLVFVSTLTFCCDGEEYSARKACLGYLDAIHGRGTACYDEKLESSGSCTSASMPPGGPAGRLDPGRVAPGSAGLSGAVDRIGPSRPLAKLGRCPRCIRLAFLLATLSWTARGTALADSPSAVVTMVAAAAFTLLLAAHLVARLVRSHAAKARGCGCGANAIAH